jgi:ABC-type nickel/cobalt efflux system permease component RcnA
MIPPHHRGTGRLITTLSFTVPLIAAPRPSMAWATSSPFGAGLSDGSVPGATLFPRIAGYLISLQYYYNQHITAAVRAVRHDSSALWTLLALSFFYGIVHAAGPGHGKAVVSSYILANRQTLRNGILLAFVASLAQAGGAILLIVVASMALHLTSVAITQATYQFEILSNLMIVFLGVWLVWSKIIRPTRSLKIEFAPGSVLTRPQRLLNRGVPASAVAFQAADVTTAIDTVTRAGAFRQAGALAHDHHHGCDCGHLHMPDAAVAAGSLDWGKAWTVVASTALRPCTGALIVLVFSISQGLFLAGVAATLVMGLGTAITVTLLAVLAVSARQTAVTLTRADSHLGRKIIRGAEACAAIAVLLFGLLLLAGTILL